MCRTAVTSAGRWCAEQRRRCCPDDATGGNDAFWERNRVLSLSKNLWRFGVRLLVDKMSDQTNRGCDGCVQDITIHYESPSRLRMPSVVFIYHKNLGESLALTHRNV